jgi:hypothetical protein
MVVVVMVLPSTPSGVGAVAADRGGCGMLVGFEKGDFEGRAR